jgi:hypothetical protein
MAQLRLNLGDRELFLKVDLFEGQEEIDVDKILKIDILNLTAEILTFPVIYNRLGLILADKQNTLKEVDLSYRIWRAKTAEAIKNEWNGDDTKKVIRGGKFTKDDVEDYIHIHPVYKAKKQQIARAEKEVAYLNSIYWAAKDKSDKLEKLSLMLKSDDIDLDNIVKSFNGVQIKVKKPLIS